MNRQKLFFFIIAIFIASISIRSQEAINDPVDLAINDEFPFNFKWIIGKTKSMSQVGCGLENGFVSPPYGWVNSKMILIGKTDYSKGNKYFQAYYYGKKFYVSAKDVILTDNMQLRLDTLSSSSKEIQDSFNNLSMKHGAYLHLAKAKDILDYVKKHRQSGLSIIKWSIYDESEYTDGTSFEIDVLNPTAKTVKYITIALVGYNPVDDKVLSKGKYTQTVKCVGPIKPDNSASYSFEYVWFTDMVERAKITSITVQYMDGSVKTISNAKAITWDSEDFKYYSEDYSDLEDI